MIRILIALLMVTLACAAQAAVDLNKASQAELESIKGIGPNMSTRILDERKNGAFKDWADVVARVKGVGPGNASKFSADGLTVNGAAFKPELLASNKVPTRAQKKESQDSPTKESPAKK